MAMQTMTVTLSNIDRLSPQAAKALGAILGCYGATFICIFRGVLSIVLPDNLVESFLMTVQRDVVPVEIETHA